jgi:alkanesulfonate monooxygenase SsuD/methylene tetrahydromethanopterin reductase-like flavin-dependent oxidoreductase (luciferase family)
MSTSFYPPFLLARLCATVDHIAHGRFGWNIVTSAEDRSAQNFGLEKLYEHSLRYDMADEYLDVVTQLWDSWEPDAVVRDRAAGTYADHTKGRPVLCQAGASPKGRDFAAKYADTIIAVGNSPAEMKSYRDDIRERAQGHGRKPDDCKVLFLVSPVVDETEEAVRAKVERWISDPAYIEHVLTELSSITEVDFAQFDLDQPLPEDLTTNGERGSLEAFMQRGSGKTLRELVGLGISPGVELIGTPDSVADKMGELMAEVGGDGFLLTCPSGGLNRRYITEITDGLVPALQRRGLTRTSYGFEHFRDNLLEF